MMERYIDQQGKTEEFRRVFEEKKGKSWMEMRRAFAFNGKFIIPTLMEVLDMSEDDARHGSMIKLQQKYLLLSLWKI